MRVRGGGSSFQNPRGGLGERGRREEGRGAEVEVRAGAGRCWDWFHRLLAGVGVGYMDLVTLWPDTPSPSAPVPRLLPACLCGAVQGRGVAPHPACVRGVHHPPRQVCAVPTRKSLDPLFPHTPVARACEITGPHRPPPCLSPVPPSLLPSFPPACLPPPRCLRLPLPLPLLPVCPPHPHPPPLLPVCPPAWRRTCPPCCAAWAASRRGWTATPAAPSRWTWRRRWGT